MSHPEPPAAHREVVFCLSFGYIRGLALQGFATQGLVHDIATIALLYGCWR